MTVELFAYVDGSDLEEVAPTLRSALQDLVQGATWAHEVFVVDDRMPQDDEVGFLPEWNLGLNLIASELDEGYWTDVRRIIACSGPLVETLPWE